jgi:molybdopterin synthase catalytic subunit
VIHRVGRIEAGDDIVLVVAAATHRQAAFDAASFVMDFLKSEAPFWKKEHRRDGADGGWVEARHADEEALRRWR